MAAASLRAELHNSCCWQLFHGTAAPLECDQIPVAGRNPDVTRSNAAASGSFRGGTWACKRCRTVLTCNSPLNKCTTSSGRSAERPGSACGQRRRAMPGLEFAEGCCGAWGVAAGRGCRVGRIDRPAAIARPATKQGTAWNHNKEDLLEPDVCSSALVVKQLSGGPASLPNHHSPPKFW